MPKRNYQFEKRQKDLAKKRKQEEKRQRKLDRKNSSGESVEEGSSEIAPPVTEAPTSTAAPSIP